MNKSTKSASFPVLTVLFFIFLVLKLTGTVTWSWWWVTAPIWGGFALAFSVLFVVFLVAAIKER